MTLWRESAEVIRSAVPYYSAPCWMTLDPASLLITSHFNEYLPVLPPEMLTREYDGDDVNKLTDVVHSRTARRRCTRRPGATRVQRRAGRRTARWGPIRS